MTELISYSQGALERKASEASDGGPRMKKAVGDVGRDAGVNEVDGIRASAVLSLK